ncbi:MAG TPA: 4Fe-4S binding protein [Chthonomonadaceae bacterium]|nr:4Fe-4S binding protein [Chthonomonadaceae bacterium]
MADFPQQMPLGLGRATGRSRPAQAPNVVAMAEIGVVTRNEPGSAAYSRFTAEQKRKMRAEPGNAVAHRTVLIRRSVQIFTFALFVLFFFLTTATGKELLGVPVNLFMTLDFLNTLKNSIASHHIPIYAIGPGVFMLLLTLWGGRIFCGWICPLGTSIDIADTLLYRKGKLFYSKKRSDTRLFRNWKYAYLLIGIGAIVFGVDVLTFGDPISLITRTFTFCFYAPVAYIWDGLVNVANQFGVGHAVYNMGGNLDTWRLPGLTYWNGVPVLLMFIGIIALSGYQERFWCRNLCPYGGLLALISRVSWLRHYIKMDGCIHCKKCEAQSRMGCYDNLEKNAKQEEMHSISECIQCFRCETICPTDVIRIRPHVPASIKEGLGLAPKGTAPRPEPQTQIDLGRRGVIASIGAGMLWGAAAKANAGEYQGHMRRYHHNNKAMRPPGALPESEFLAACTRCAECMKVCPTNALQPATLETGIQGIWTPLLVPSVGPCAEKCTSCGDVCPTGAIRPFTWEDKRYKLKMGLANVNRSTCVAWNGGRDCIVCAEVCPYSAVIFKDTMDDTLPIDPALPITAKLPNGKENKGRVKRVPTVDEKLCTGCGLCEYHCPVLPDHSIVVYTFQEDRGEQDKPGEKGRFVEPKESPVDGFWRKNWDERKEAGKTEFFKATAEEFEKYKAISGPDGAASPSSYNPNPNP